MGARRRVTRSGPPCTVNLERAAHERLAKLITEAAAGEMPAPAELMLGLWLDKSAARASRGKAATTIYDRARTVKLISAGPGKLRLDKLTPSRIQDWLDELTLSQRSRIKALQFLKAALSEAVALGQLSCNPAAPVKLARVSFRPKGSAWMAEQARRLPHRQPGYRARPHLAAGPPDRCADRGSAGPEKCWPRNWATSTG